MPSNWISFFDGVENFDERYLGNETIARGLAELNWPPDLETEKLAQGIGSLPVASALGINLLDGVGLDFEGSHHFP